MSDTPQNTAIILDQVQHDTCLPAKIEALFCSKAFSDIMLLVEKQKIPSHKLILASRSDFFRDLLYGENKNVTELELKDTPLSSFIVLLQYIYTGRIVVDSQAENSTLVVLNVLVLAHRYGFSDLESSISSHLGSLLNEKNLSTIYEYVRKLDWSSLSEACQNFADNHAEDVIADKSFLQLSSEAMREVISRDSFLIPEVKIFNTVWAWKQKHPDQSVENLLSAVRLPLMDQQDLLNVVLATKLISSEVILEAFRQKKEGSTSTLLRYRGHLVIDSNLATKRYKAKVIHGLQPQNLLGDIQEDYDDTRGITAHKIGEENGQGIVVKLGKPYIINHIRMLMMDRESRAYSYYVEVSVNNEDWVEVIDHRNYPCRSWQEHNFEPQVARYIRIMGTKNYSDKPHFGLVKLLCMFSIKKANMQNGFHCPIFQMENPIHLFIGDEQTFWPDSDIFQIPSIDKVVKICYAQPIFVNMISLQLSENEEERFKFYIEVSTDGVNWCKVVDKQDEEFSGCVSEEFPERLILMVRFVATFYSGGNEEEFKLSNFGCYYKQPLKVEAPPSPIITPEDTVKAEPVQEAEIPPTEPQAESDEATMDAEEKPFIPSSAFSGNEMLLEKSSSGRWGLVLGVVFCFAVLVVLCYV